MNAIEAARTEGYREPRDYRELSFETQKIDKVMAALAKCPKCSTWGMVYVPLVKFEHGVRTGYRAFAKCLKCGAVVEF